MNVMHRTKRVFRAFFGGALIGVFLMWGGLFLDKAGFIDLAINHIWGAGAYLFLDADGTIGGARVSCTGTANYECLLDASGTSTAPSAGSHVLFDDGEQDYYEVTEISGVDTVTAIDVWVYHRETNASEAVYISLWDNTEGGTPYGAEQQLTTITTAGWDNYNYTGLSLTSGQLDGLKIRVRCVRPGGGSKGDCEVYDLYPWVTYTESIDVIVTATGTQQDLKRGTTSAYLGGTFLIEEETASRNITDITITENGSINAQTNLDNIELWYDLDTTSSDGYTCTDEQFDGDETQFGSTDTDGFSGADGTSAFQQLSSPPSISTTQSMCVYVVLDVGTGAAIGDEIQIEITDPSTDVDGSSAPTVRPQTTEALSGVTTVRDEDVQVTDFHWRDDSGNETGADSATLDVDNTDILTGAKETNYRLRFAVSNEGNATTTAKQYRIEYGTKVTECSAIGTWHNVGDTGGDWDMVGTGSGLSEGSNTTNIAENVGGIDPDPATSFLAVNGGQREETSQTGDIVLNPDQFVELEYAIIASTTVSDGTTYCFRLSDAGSVTEVNNLTTYPEFTVAADLTVEANGSQTNNISIPTTFAYNGGQFAISDSTAGAHQVQSVTITASGTVDLQGEIGDIGLYYDLDTTNFDCSAESFNGDETQYGATTTGGFSGGNTATFSGGVSVSPSQAMCLYVVYDVLSSSTDSDLIEIRLADPSTDIVVDTGSVSPVGLLDITGVTTLIAPYVQQGSYHWRNNDGDEAGATSATGGTENTIYSEVPRFTTIRARFDVSNTGGEASGNYQYELQWAQKVSSCDLVSEGSWTDVDVANDEFEMFASQLTENGSTTDVAVSSGGVTNLANNFTYNTQAQKETTSQTPNLNLLPDYYAELEYSIQATASTSEGASYCFRVTNNGTALDNYVNYPELNIKPATDFIVQRGQSIIQAGSTTASISVSNGDYSLQFASSSRAFVRITNMANTGAGFANAANNTPDNVTAFVQNPGNITSQINFERQGTTNSTLINWEVIEYIGEAGGENEIIVKQHGVASHTAVGTTVSTGAVSSIVDDNDVVAWITGQGNESNSRFEFHTGVSTAAWNAGSDTATFTRDDSNAIVNVSYAVIEFTGANWIIQRSEHTYATAGISPEEDTGISSVNSIAQTFLHVQKRIAAGEDGHADFGHEVYMSGVGAVQYFLDGDVNDPTQHTSVAWVIENTQSTGNVMNVERSAGPINPGTAPVIVYPPIGATIDDLTIASIFVNGRSDGTGRSFQEPIFAARLLNSSTTNYELWVGDPAQTINYQTQVVEWPTAAAKIFQNDFWWYEDNDALTPSTVWSGLGENEAMTGETDPIATGERIRLRMSLRIEAAAQPAGVDAFSLYYAARPEGETCSAQTAWYEFGDIGSTTALWRGYDGTRTDGETLDTLLLTESTTFGTYEEQNDTSLTPVSAFVNDVIEFDWMIEDNGAADKTDYCFKMVYADGTPLEDIDNYPVIRTVGYGPVQGDWKWFDDETSLTPLDINALAATNTAPSSVAHDNIIKLRTVVSEKSGASGVDTKFKLQFSEYSDFSKEVFDVVASSTCTQDATTTKNIWCYDDGAGVDNAVIDDNVLSTADSCASGVGNGCGTHNEGIASTTATLDQPALTNMEFEFTLRNDGARANAVYYFRLYDVQNQEPVAASSTFPSLQVAGADLEFTLSGVTAGTISEGVEADVSTTPTSIPFGSVPQNTEYEAIYRLNVNTNATQGYQLLMFATQDMLNTYGEPIPNVTAPNSLPVGWSSACPSEATGCFGYHVGDDTLQGGSTRFAPDNTYAAISTTTPEEVMYSSVATNDTTDMVFKVEIGALQTAGDYETEIIYLAIPVF